MAKKNNTPKKLNLTNVNKVDKKVFTQSDMVIGLQGQDFIVKIDDVFRTSKIDKAFHEFGEIMDYCEKNGIQWNSVSLNLIVILQNFTDIKFPDDTLKKFQLLTSLTDHGVVDKVFNKFDSDELEKLDKRFEELNATLPKMIESFSSENSRLTQENIEKINKVADKSLNESLKISKDKTDQTIEDDSNG